MAFRKWNTWGVEFTYLPTERTTAPSNYLDGFSFYPNTQALRYLIDQYKIKLKYKNKKPFNVYNDEGCLEVASPVFNNMSDMKGYFNKMSEIVKKDGFVAHKDDDYSGGGHIHVKLKKFTKEFTFSFLMNLYADMNNRPYLNWFFNEAGDNVSAQPYKMGTVFTLINKTPEQSHKQIMQFLAEMDYKEEYGYWQNINTPAFKEKQKKHKLTMSDILQHLSGDKGRAVRLDREFNKPDTIEFRIMDAYDSYEQLKNMVEFVHAYLQYIERMTKSQVEIKYKRFPFDKNPRPPFKKLIEEIGLSYKTYKKYTARYDEWEWNWLK